MCLSLVKKMRNIEKFRTFADLKKQKTKTKQKLAKTTKNKKESILKTRLGLKRLIYLMF